MVRIEFTKQIEIVLKIFSPAISSNYLIFSSTIKQMCIQLKISLEKNFDLNFNDFFYCLTRNKKELIPFLVGILDQ